jgi:hypothetical protein
VIFWIVAAAIGVVGLQLYQSRNRREEIRQLAAEKRWKYFEIDQELAYKWLGPPFNRGESGKALNVLRGKSDKRRVTVFDLAYYLRRLPVRRHFAVIAVQLPKPLPWLEVVYEKVQDAIRITEDVQFGSELFDRTFRVTCGNEQFARAVIHPRLMEFLLDRSEISWRIAGDHLLGWQSGLYDPIDLDRWIDLLCEIADQIPPAVWTDYEINGDS